MIVEPVTTDPELIKLFLSINDAVRAYDEEAILVN